MKKVIYSVPSFTNTGINLLILNLLVYYVINIQPMLGEGEMLTFATTASHEFGTTEFRILLLKEINHYHRESVL